MRVKKSPLIKSKGNEYENMEFTLDKILFLIKVGLRFIFRSQFTHQVLVIIF